MLIYAVRILSLYETGFTRERSFHMAESSAQARSLRSQHFYETMFEWSTLKKRQSGSNTCGWPGSNMP